MFRDREGGDCMGNTWSPVYQGWVQGPRGKEAVASIQNPPIIF